MSGLKQKLFHLMLLACTVVMPIGAGSVFGAETPKITPAIATGSDIQVEQVYWRDRGWRGRGWGGRGWYNRPYYPYYNNYYNYYSPNYYSNPYRTYGNCSYVWSNGFYVYYCQ